MISQVAVVFVLVLAIGQGAERGERCTNEWGEKATCTNINSCKAAMDAVAVANGTQLYATGVLCGYDIEPLVCCRTVADFNETSVNNTVPSESSTTEPSSNTNSSVDLNISTNTSTFNESVQVVQVLELSNSNASPTDANSVTQIWNILTSQPSGMTESTTDSLDELVGSNNQLTTSSTIPADEVIYTTPPILITSDKTSVVAPSIPSAGVTTNVLVDSTTINPSESPKDTEIPDALALQLNDTSDSSTPPDDSCGCEYPDVTSNIIPETPQSSPVDTPTTPPTFNKFTELPITRDFNETSVNNTVPSESSTTEPSSTTNLSVDLNNISTNTSTFNESVQVVEGLELSNSNASPADANSVTSQPAGVTKSTTDSLDELVGSNNQLTTGSTTSTETPQSSPVDTPTTAPTFNKFTELPITSEVATEVHINNLLPDRNMCGFQMKRNRMADAPIASIDEFPWVALLRYQDKYGKDAGFRCVGTLINHRYVITSAHCVLTDTELLYLKSVRLGEWSISNPTDCVSESDGEVCPDEVVDVGIEKKIPHPNYNPKSGSDIALIRMERDVHFTDYVRPICLPVEHLEIPLERTILKSSGWGTSKSGSLLDIKSKIHLPVLSKEKCLKKVSRFMPLVEGQFCVDVIFRNNICRTDSGGPLMVLDKENEPQWYLEGVIPEGFYCDQRWSLGVYTRVTEYISWIMSTLEQGSA